MKTDVITIYGDLRGRDMAMKAAQKFAAYYDLTGNDAMHLRLLTEETISMIHGILDDFHGSLWLESEQTKNGLLCRVCLSTQKQANREQEAQILSVSTSGKNENAKGVMGRIREIFRRSLQTDSEADEQFMQNINDAWMGMENGNSFSVADSNYWSLRMYRMNLEAVKAGKALNMVAALDCNVNDLRVSYVATENKKVPDLGVVQADKYALYFKTRKGGERRDKESSVAISNKGDGNLEPIYMWITPDESRTVVSFSAAIAVGKVEGRLVKATGTRTPVKTVK